MPLKNQLSYHENGSVLLFNYSGLCGTFFGVRKSVFLHFDHWIADTVSPTHKKNIALTCFVFPFRFNYLN